jgi:ribose transport system substrate-binding protein
MAPYLDHPSAFPVTTPLRRRPTGATIAYVNCGNPSCSLLYQSLKAAASTMGVKLNSIAASVTIQGAVTALDTAIQERPNAVIVPAYATAGIKNQLLQLKALGIPIIGFALIGGTPYGVQVSVGGAATWSLIPKLEAAYAFSLTNTKTHVLLVSAPEIQFTPPAIQSFVSELSTLCKPCSVTKLSLSVTTIGTTAPQQIVSALQANPNVTTVVAPNSEIFDGLPSALKSAGISVKLLGGAGNPTNLTYVKEGTQAADVQFDFPVTAWMAVDDAARLITKQPLTPNASTGQPDIAILRSGASFTISPIYGWTGYPDFAQRFARLWGLTK